jgi:amino acid transporter
MSSHKKSKSAAFRTSLMVALALAIFTIGEYFLALVYSGAALLMLVGLIKAYFVVNFYMHISRLWTPEEGH